MLAAVLLSQCHAAEAQKTYVEVRHVSRYSAELHAWATPTKSAGITH